jgi:hypothetical protein
LEFLLCALTLEVQCFTVHPSHMILRTKIRQFWRTGNDSKQPYCHKCTRYRVENHRLAASHWQTLSHDVVHLVLSGIRTQNVNGDRHWLHSSCKSNYHTTTTSPMIEMELGFSMIWLKYWPSGAKRQSLSHMFHCIYLCIEYLKLVMLNLNTHTLNTKKVHSKRKWEIIPQQTRFMKCSTQMMRQRLWNLYNKKT